MYCTKCGLPTTNGERQCKQCGTELDRSGSTLTVMAARTIIPEQRRPLSQLAAWFMGLSGAGLACMIGSTVIAWLLERARDGVSPGQWNLGLAGLSLMALGFVLLCSALLFGLLAFMRLRQDRRLRGRSLLTGGALVWLLGAALFFTLRSNPHYRPPVPPLRSTTPAFSPARP